MTLGGQEYAFGSGRHGAVQDALHVEVAKQGMFVLWRHAEETGAVIDSAVVDFFVIPGQSVDQEHAIGSALLPSILQHAAVAVPGASKGGIATKGSDIVGALADPALNSRSSPARHVWRRRWDATMGIATVPVQVMTLVAIISANTVA